MIYQTVRVLLLAALVLLSSSSLQSQSPSLTTRWTDTMNPDSILPEYPRPQMVRTDWLNLNGRWQYALTAPDGAAPSAYEGDILVPFPIESRLSGVQRRVDGNALWYRRSITIPDGWAGQRVLLHFGAVDWETTVWVNGVELGSHQGGYDAFSFDITDALTGAGEQELVVRVFDPSDASTQPRGKQVRVPEGIWYTPTTGIWQTVWLEPTPQAAINSLKLTPDVDSSTITLEVETTGETAGGSVRVTILEDGAEIATEQSATPQNGRFTITATLDNPRLWAPGSPFLYDARIELLSADGTVSDTVTSYFGMRKIALGRDANGDVRLFLNNEPLFQFGLLDQGFWPDGLYTAPTDDALRYDIEITQQLGFNVIRKHVKVEPDRWYYWTDRLGLIVWQDMPSGDAYAGWGDDDITRTPESAAQFEAELQEMIEGLYNHPSIVMWVPFNEGWGQYDTARIAEWVRTLDPTRLVNSASGWNDRGVGDVYDIHSYPGPDAPPADPNRAAVLGEFGGLGLPISGHTWQDEANWGYRQFEDVESLRTAYANLITTLRTLIEDRGLAAAIYTQTTDVEIEVNGMLTYDREIVKMGVDEVRAINEVVYAPLPQPVAIVPTSEQEGQTWRYTTETPPENWAALDFDDSAWSEGIGGFGRADAPVDYLRTEWTTPDLWLRREFTLESTALNNPFLIVHHVQNAEIYLNGERIALLALSSTDYVRSPFRDEAWAALREGRNVLAVHVSDPSPLTPPPAPFGQYIDVGLYQMAANTP